MLSRLAFIYGNYQLNKRRKNLLRNKSSLDFKNAKTIALIFDATNPDDFNRIKEFIKWLREQKNTVRSIAFINQKQISPQQYSKLEYDFISQKELNWWKKPTANFVETFLNEEFDIMINLSLTNVFPITYIYALSKAKFKISIFNQNTTIDSDLLIDIKDNRTIEHLIKQVTFFLLKINQKNYATNV